VDSIGKSVKRGMARRLCSEWSDVAAFGVPGLNCGHHIASVQKDGKTHNEANEEKLSDFSAYVLFEESVFS